MSNFKVLIAGAGLGGLTLAQSLVRAGIDFEVFERDESPFGRPQGYRLHLDADAINAAAEVLPSHLHAVFEHTSQWTEPYTTILGKDLSVVKRLMTGHDHGEDVWPVHSGPPVHANVDRATLRQIMLAGLNDKVHYDKTLDHYESYADGVIAHFTDGTSVVGDVLVGADGIRSAVRRQRAPDAKMMDAGITAIYGRIPFSAAAALVPPETLGDIFTIALDERKVCLGLGSVHFPMRPEEAAAKFAPDAAMRPQDDYVVCIVNGRHEFFPSGLREASAAELQRIATTTIGAWPDHTRNVVSAGDPASFFLIEMSTSVPCTLDTPTNATLLGDAIHTMTPTLGRGANVAMRDGVLLGRQLRKVAGGSSTLSEALAVYEQGMIDYGFAVVREAAGVGQQRIAQNPLPA